MCTFALGLAHFCGGGFWHLVHAIMLGQGLRYIERATLQVWLGSYALGFQRCMLGENYVIVLEASEIEEETQLGQGWKK